MRLEGGIELMEALTQRIKVMMPKVKPNTLIQIGEHHFNATLIKELFKSSRKFTCDFKIENDCLIATWNNGYVRFFPTQVLRHENEFKYYAKQIHKWDENLKCEVPQPKFKDVSNVIRI